MGESALERFYRDRPILVTGAAGFIGRHLLRRLHQLGARVSALDLTVGEPLPGVRWLSRDIRRLNPPDLADLQAEAVFHLAAVLGVRYAAAHPAETVSVNVAGTARLLALAQAMGCRRFCLLSSSEVYGEPDALPITEETPLHPRSVYGWSKLCAEELLRAHTGPGLAGTVIRPFNVYGPEQRGEFVVSRFIRQAQAGGPLTIAGDGSQRRGFTYVEDLVAGMLLAVALQTSPLEVFNIAGEGEVAIADLAARILALTGSQAAIAQVPLVDLGRDPQAEVRLRVPSIEKARRELGYTPAVGLETGLARTIRAQAGP